MGKKEPGRLLPIWIYFNLFCNSGSKRGSPKKIVKGKKKEKKCKRFMKAELEIKNKKNRLRLFWRL